MTPHLELLQFYYFASEVPLCCNFFILDGFAGLIGKEFGRMTLPWNRSKTYLGTFAFFAASSIGCAVFIDIFQRNGWFNVNWPSFFPILVLVSAASAIVESLPSQQDWDNVSVFLIAVSLLKGFGY